jgi:hypothetical protein
VLQYIGRPLWESDCTTPVPRQCKVYAPIHMSMVSKPDIGLLCIPSRPKADNSVGGQRFATRPLFDLVVGMVLHFVARKSFRKSPPARASLPITRSRLKRRAHRGVCCGERSFSDYAPTRETCIALTRDWALAIDTRHLASPTITGDPELTDNAERDTPQKPGMPARFHPELLPLPTNVPTTHCPFKTAPAP